MSFFGGLIAFAFGAILRFLFGAVSMAYDVIIVLANVDLFGFNTSDSAGSLWHSISERIYILLGIFMLFRVGFSMLQYIIDPDKMTDKQAGIGNIIKRTIIALLILVLFQPAFSLLMSFQNKIISSNVLGTVILGVQGDPTNKAADMGNVLPSTIIQSMTSVSDEWSDANNANCKELGTWADIIADNGTCKEKLEEGMDDKYKLEEMVIPANWQRWFDIEITTKGTEGGVFASAAYQSNFLLLAIVALVVLWCLFSLGLQLGVRIIKLGFLALIAPIPIISYIEPSQGKNGMLGKWAKEFLKTYLSLFIRLAALYFAILIVILVEDSVGDPFKNVVDYNGKSVSDNILVIGQVKIIILIAAFLFADQVPKMIENIFGLKMEGGMFKSPFKQMRESKSLMGTAGRAAGAALAGASLLGKNGKLANFKKNASKDWAAVKGGTMRQKASFAATQVARAGTLASSVTRGGKDMAKYLQEHKDEGFLENIQDAQVKNEERLHNRQGRQAQDMWDRMRGLDLQKEDEKKEIENRKKSLQVRKDEIDEIMRKDKEDATSQKSLKEGLSKATDFAESEIEKKNRVYADHLKAVEAAKAVADDAKVKLSDLEAKRDEAKRAYETRKDTLAGESQTLGNAKVNLENQLKDLRAQSLMAPTEAMKANIDAQINARQNELAQVDARIGAISGEEAKLKANFENAEAAYVNQQVISKNASKTYADLDKGGYDENGNKIKGTSDIKDDIVQAAIKVAAGKGEKEDIELAAGVDTAKLKTNLDALDNTLIEFGEFLARKTNESNTLKKQLEELKNTITTLENSGASATEIEKVQSQKRQVEERLARVDTAITSGTVALTTARENKEKNGYYVVDDIKGNFKALEREAMELESASQTAYGPEKRALEADIKEYANQIAKLEEEIRAIKEKTKGAGVHNETFNTGDLGHGPGPMGPPPGE